MDFNLLRMDVLQSFANTLGLIIQFILWLFFLYYFGISIYGWFRRREQPTENFPIKNRFAIIISAHNEESVIGGAIRSLKSLKYPSDMYDIFVIADNCTDSTAQVARETGAKVFERSDDVRKGKGHALEWMFKVLFELDKKYDAITILDADNLVSKNFLLEMNKKLILGHKVIQGYLDSKNPHDSWISANYSIAYWISNRLFQLPRFYLGLNCALGGTGFVMATSVLRDIGWGATCLTEDLEFSMKLVLKGLKVAWAHDAIVYDEKPLKMMQSWKQRKRWMQGHCDCASRYFIDLMKMAIEKRSMVALDSAFYLMQPFIIVANGLASIYGLITWVATFSAQDYKINVIGFMLLLFVVTYVNIIFVLVEGKLTKKIVYYFLYFPLYSLTWIPIIIAGFLDRNKRDWVHTLHTRALDIDDMERVSIEKVG